MQKNKIKSKKILVSVAMKDQVSQGKDIMEKIKVNVGGLILNEIIYNSLY